MRDLEKLADEIARKIDRAVNGVEQKVKNRWNGQWEVLVHSATHPFKRVPDRLSDLATDGSCVMRYLFAYGFIGMAALQGFSGLMLVLYSLAEHRPWANGTTSAMLEPVSIGLVLMVMAQFTYWAGRRIKRSADEKARAKNQLRILRLAREKGGSLTVIEAATESKITVEKTEELLRELVLSGHAEMRISESGLVVYHFLEIERWDEKHWARPVDEL